MHNLFKSSGKINFLQGFIFLSPPHHCMLQVCISKVTHFLYVHYFWAMHQSPQISIIMHLISAAAPTPNPGILFCGLPKLPLKSVPTRLQILCSQNIFCGFFLVSLILSLMVFDGCTNSFNQSVILQYRHLSHMLSTSLCLVKHQMDETAV